MAVPQWVLEKQRIQSQEPEELVFVGELGATGVINGKLPNGEDYDYLKKRDIRSRHKLAAIADKVRNGSFNDNVEVPLDDG